MRFVYCIACAALSALAVAPALAQTKINVETTAGTAGAALFAAKVP
jgi:hypothetical protein